MTLEQYVISSILKYPDLYKDVTYRYSKQKVLNHIYFVNGTGLEWSKGELVRFDELDPPSILKLPDSYFTTPVMSEEKDESSWSKMWRLEDNKEFTPIEKCNKTSLNIYPISDNSNIMNLPEDIKLDWLYGAQEAIAMAYKYYSDPYRHARHIYINEWILTRNIAAIHKFIKKEIKYLNSASIRVERLLNNAE